jgi:dinuclear metal center YbgI/SA1388 family protein
MASRDDITAFLDDYLNINDISDKSSNGLQVQGNDTIERVGLATDAALVTYRRAIEADCQMLIVHHGLIWNGIRYVTGRTYDHFRYLIENSLNLYAAHLPLDLHSEVGNNALLANMADLTHIRPFGDYYGITIGYCGTFREPIRVEALEALFARGLDCTPRTLAFGPESIRTAAIISGGGASLLDEAISRNMDCLITGEGTHDRYHQAAEGRIHLMYLGHYKSETVGVRALGERLKEEFRDLETVFIDEPTGF